MASTAKKFNNVNLNAPKKVKATIFETVVTSAKPSSLTSTAAGGAAAPARSIGRAGLAGLCSLASVKKTGKKVGLLDSLAEEAKGTKVIDEDDKPKPGKDEDTVEESAVENSVSGTGTAGVSATEKISWADQSDNLDEEPLGLNKKNEAATKSKWGATTAAKSMQEIMEEEKKAEEQRKKELAKKQAEQAHLANTGWHAREHYNQGYNANGFAGTPQVYTKGGFGDMMKGGYGAAPADRDLDWRRGGSSSTSEPLESTASKPAAERYSSKQYEEEFSKLREVKFSENPVDRAALFGSANKEGLRPARRGYQVNGKEGSKETSSNSGEGPGSAPTSTTQQVEEGRSGKFGDEMAGAAADNYNQSSSNRAGSNRNTSSRRAGGRRGGASDRDAYHGTSRGGTGGAAVVHSGGYTAGSSYKVKESDYDYEEQEDTYDSYGATSGGNTKGPQQADDSHDYSYAGADRGDMRSQDRGGRGGGRDKKFGSSRGEPVSREEFGSALNKDDKYARDHVPLSRRRPSREHAETAPPAAQQQQQQQQMSQNVTQGYEEEKWTAEEWAAWEAESEWAARKSTLKQLLLRSKDFEVKSGGRSIEEFLLDQRGIFKLEGSTVTLVDDPYLKPLAKDPLYDGEEGYGGQATYKHSSPRKFETGDVRGAGYTDSRGAYDNYSEEYEVYGKQHPGSHQKRSHRGAGHANSGASDGQGAAYDHSFADMGADNYSGHGSAQKDHGHLDRSGDFGRHQYGNTASNTQNYISEAYMPQAPLGGGDHDGSLHQQKDDDVDGGGHGAADKEKRNKKKKNKKADHTWDQQEWTAEEWAEWEAWEKENQEGKKKKKDRQPREQHDYDGDEADGGEVGGAANGGGAVKNGPSDKNWRAGNPSGRKKERALAEQAVEDGAADFATQNGNGAAAPTRSPNLKSLSGAFGGSAKNKSDAAKNKKKAGLSQNLNHVESAAANGGQSKRRAGGGDAGKEDAASTPAPKKWTGWGKPDPDTPSPAKSSRANGGAGGRIMEDHQQLQQQAAASVAAGASGSSSNAAGERDTTSEMKKGGNKKGRGRGDRGDGGDRGADGSKKGSGGKEGGGAGTKSRGGKGGRGGGKGGRGAGDGGEGDMGQSQSSESKVNTPTDDVGGGAERKGKGKRRGGGVGGKGGGKGESSSGANKGESSGKSRENKGAGGGDGGTDGGEKKPRKGGGRTRGGS
eukprot:g795.t1